jgi:hypothetical protein
MLGLGDAVRALTTGGKVLVGLVVTALLVLAVMKVVDLVNEGFIPINADLLNQRSVTNILKTTNKTLPKKWDPEIEPPMATQILIDNKLRGDELQKAMSRLQ